jgi:hypothetical protein
MHLLPGFPFPFRGVVMKSWPISCDQPYRVVTVNHKHVPAFLHDTQCAYVFHLQLLVDCCIAQACFML